MPDASQYPDSVREINPEQTADKIRHSAPNGSAGAVQPKPDQGFRSIGEVLKGAGLL